MRRYLDKLPEAMKAILIAFGDLQSHDGRLIPSSEIKTRLLERGYWLTPRIAKGTQIGMRVLFYQSAVGIVSIATLKEVSKAELSDTSVIASSPDLFAFKLHLGDIEIFAEAIDIRPLIRELTFIGNKKYWGHSFRSTPRLIEVNDLERIVTKVD